MLKNLFQINGDPVSDMEGQAFPDKDPILIAVGPLNKQPNTVKMRVVMCQWYDGTFSTHIQCFPTEGDQYLTDGVYFGSNNLSGVTEDFCQRLEKSAPYLQSLYRS